MSGMVANGVPCIGVMIDVTHINVYEIDASQLRVWWRINQYLPEFIVNEEHVQCGEFMNLLQQLTHICVNVSV